MRLTSKVFLAFALTSLATVVLLVAAIQILAHRSFAEYVTEVELGSLDTLVHDLEDYYGRNGSWQALAGDLNEWRVMLEPHLPERRNAVERNPPPASAGYPASPSAGYRPQARPPGTGRLRHPPHPPPHLPPDPQGTDTRPPPPGRPGWFTGPRLSLFTPGKEVLAGLAKSARDHVFRPIVVDREVVGFLGLSTVSQLSHPLNVDFLRQQRLAFYAAGLCTFALAAVVSLILSRHLLGPIRELARGTKALISFDFDARIRVQTRDELGQLAADFNRMAETLQESEQTRQKWIADISHELRTPLSVLRGEIEALQDGVRPMNRDTLGSLFHEVQRLAKLVEDLHLLSKADSQRLGLRLETVSPLETLKTVLRAYAHRLEEADIRVQINEEQNGKRQIRADSHRLVQLFTNILENTLRYTDSPGLVRVRERGSDGTLTLWIEDSAPGVPDDALVHLCDRLYRVEVSRSRALGGSGLGLAICKEIMEAHGGTLRVAHSALGGICIKLDFPRVDRYPAAETPR
jgi:two-component system sensor histidine kinase BaeS